MNIKIRDTVTLKFRHVYSHPESMERVVQEFYNLFEQLRKFLLPVKVNSIDGLGWVLLELLNNAVRSPLSLAVNKGIYDINKIDLYTDIIITKSITTVKEDGLTEIEISVKNRGDYVEDLYTCMQQILNGSMSILDCEECFRHRGSYTGNGGMGIILSKRQVENALGGTLSLEWDNGFYDFIIKFKTEGLSC